MATYDPKKIVFTFGGAIITGYADGTGISVDRTADTWAMHTGMDDQTTFTKINNSTGSIVLTLQQGSFSNDVMSGFMKLDETGNLGLLPYLLKDILGATTASGTGRILKPPTLGFANDHTSREWTITCDKMGMFIGGNL